MAKRAEERREQAEAQFKKKAEAATEGAKAKAQYDAAAQATLDKTSRLRALRLAKEAEEQRSKPEKRPVVLEGEKKQRPVVQKDRPRVKPR